MIYGGNLLNVCTDNFMILTCVLRVYLWSFFLFRCGGFIGNFFICNRMQTRNGCNGWVMILQYLDKGELSIRIDEQQYYSYEGKNMFKKAISNP